jgi:hypothetical protein
MPFVVVGYILISGSFLACIAAFWDLERSTDPGADVIDVIAFLPLALLTFLGWLLIRRKRVLKRSTLSARRL